MKALAGMLLAVALAVGVCSEADAQQCPPKKRDAKHVTKTSRSTSKRVCTCRYTHKSKKPRASVMKTSTYAGYVPIVETPVVERESDLFPVNPLPTPQGTWDNTGRDLRRYPPESHVLGGASEVNPNWLQSTEQNK